MKRFLIILLLAVVMLSGCAPTGPTVRSDVDPDDPTVLSERGEHDRAAERWLELAQQAALSNPARAAEARLAAAEAWLAADQPNQALAVLDTLDRARLSPAQRIRLDLVQAEVALVNEDFATARWILDLPADQVPVSLQARFSRLQSALAARDPDSIDARLEQMRIALQDGTFAPALALDMLLEFPVSTIEQSLQQASANSDPMLLPWLELALVSREFLLDDAARAAGLAQWQTNHAELNWTAQSAEQAVQRWKASQPKPARIAVLLPGEGRLERAGQVLRDGLLSAWLAKPDTLRPELNFYYLEDRPDAAVGALFRAQADGVEAVIGPLDRQQIRSVLALPDGGLPMLLLNRPPEPTALLPAIIPSRSVSILALPPEEEAELAAVRALVEGHRRALVVAQGSDWGQRVSQRFIDTFELGGGRVLARADYDNASFDHTAQLEVLLELDRSNRRIETLASVLNTELEAEPQLRTDADLIFLAAPEGDALQLMPQLRFLDADELSTYATSHAYSSRGSTDDLRGMEFPAAPWMIPSTESGQLRSRVQQRYPELNSASLSQLHALGRDAIELMPWLAMMKQDRQLYLAGHVGRLRLADGILFERDLPWARIDQGQIVLD